MNVPTNLLLIIVVLGGIAALQFYKGRKINTDIMIHYIRKFEEQLNLRDKNYIYLGGYVGFKADYELKDKNVSRINLVLTLLARQSLFWLPFSYPVKRGDRLYIVIHPKFRIRGDAHVVQNYYYLFGPKITERNTMTKEKTQISKYSNFYTLYKNKEDSDRLRKLVEETFDPRRVRHIALNTETNTLFCLIKPDLKQTPKELKKLLENFPKIFEDWTYFGEE